jgi:hypothetical protein
MGYHFLLRYSNWETATVCLAESFESLSQGFPNALWELGGVPQRHRTDRLSAAINDHCDKEFFTQRYRAWLAHSGWNAQAIAARQAHPQGDVEQSHHRFQTAVDQALMLRGSREFRERAGDEQCLRELCAQRHRGRAERFAEERPTRRDLPSRRMEAWQRQKVRVTQGSTIRVRTHTDAVPSQLMGEYVDVPIMAAYLEVWHGAGLVERGPRLRGRNQYAINDRHVIDWLVRKPGAVAADRYQDAMVPSSRLRRASDALLEHSPARAAKDYLRILELAAKGSEAGVDDVLGRLLEWTVSITPPVVEDHLRHDLGRPRAMDVVITQVDLSMYDL